MALQAGTVADARLSRAVLGLLAVVCLKTAVGDYGLPIRCHRWQPRDVTPRLSLRGGSNSDTQMDVDSVAAVPKGDAAAGAAVADHYAAAASGLVNVTVKWKLKSFALEIDTCQPTEVLKYQLYSLTQVAPEDQFLIGIYQPGQDANLRELDFKNSQVLILLGDPARAPPPPLDIGYAAVSTAAEAVATSGPQEQGHGPEDTHGGAPLNTGSRMVGAEEASVMETDDDEALAPEGS